MSMPLLPGEVAELSRSRRRRPAAQAQKSAQEEDGCIRSVLLYGVAVVMAIGALCLATGAIR